MKKARAGSNQGIISIPTLKDGVGRQAPSKRLPTESEVIDNVLLSLERSAQKRSGFEILLNENNEVWTGDLETQPQVPDVGMGTYTTPTDERISEDASSDTWYFWFELTSDDLFLIQATYVAADYATASGASTPIITIIRVNDNKTWTLEDTITAADVTEEAFDYLMHLGATNFAQNIKAINVGADILMLNTKVKAGFSSTLHSSGEWRTHDLFGAQTTTEDILGREVKYKTALRVDPTTRAPILLTNNVYTRDALVFTPWQGPTDTGGVYRCASATRDTASGTETPQTNPGTLVNGDTANGWEFLRDVEVINAEDFTYPDPINPRFGQAVNSFRDLPFPPVPENMAAGEFVSDTSDFIFDWAYSSLPVTFTTTQVAAADTIAALYQNWDGVTRWNVGSFRGEPSDGSNIFGRGKIYYCKNAFLEAPPGWYRVVSDDVSPYYRRVRSPDAFGRLDPNRLPHRLKRNADNTWSFSVADWDVRMAGTRTDNPGPKVFRNGVQTEITDIATFQNRLYMSAGDTVFSSRLGEFTDFWIKDPGNLTDADPIDTTLSTNSYARVSYMVPFRDQLFIVTESSTQFALTGFENVISPFTVEVQPISFYTTSGVTNPVAVGNSIYFANDRRMYMYYPENSDVGQTMEMSKHCPDYLPDNPTGLYSASANDTLFVTSGNEADNDCLPHHLFGYTSRFTGNEITQNAFWRWKMDTDDATGVLSSVHRMEIRSAYTKDNYLYFVFSAFGGDEISTTGATNGVYVGRIYLQDDGLDAPRLDHLWTYTQTGTPNWIYFVEVSSFTTILVDSVEDFSFIAGGTLVLESFENEDAGTGNNNITANLPLLLDESGIIIDVDTTGDFAAYITTGSAFGGPPTDGTKQFGVYFVNSEYDLVLDLPTQAKSFGFSMSGWQDGANTGTVTVTTYLQGDPDILVETINLPFNVGIDSAFAGFATENAFDKVVITIASADDEEAGTEGGDYVNFDQIYVGYSEPSLGKTWFCIPMSCSQVDTVWLQDGWGANSYTELAITDRIDRAGSDQPSWVAVNAKFDAPVVNDTLATPTYTVPRFSDLPLSPSVDETAYTTVDGLSYIYKGAWILNTVSTWVSKETGSDIPLTATLSFGRKFDMVIELSQQFIRDQSNNSVEGVLSMRQIVTRHRNTGEYTIKILSLNNVLRSSSFFLRQKTLNTKNEVTSLPIQVDGEKVSKVMGFSERSVIRIESDSILPVNITNITIRGKFRPKNSTFLS